MKLLIDACLPRALVEFFRQLKHEAIYVRDEFTNDLSDEKIIEFCKANKFILLTRDKGFNYSESIILEEEGLDLAVEAVKKLYNFRELSTWK